MSKPGCLLLMTGLLLASCHKKSETAARKPTNSATASGNLLTAPVDYLGAVGQAKKTAIKVIDKSSLSRQIELFHEQEDRYPASLKELVEQHYVNSVPAPPYGMKYQYDPRTGKLDIVKQ